MSNGPIKLAIYTTITQEAFAHFIDPPYIGMRSLDLVVIARPSDRESGRGMCARRGSRWSMWSMVRLRQKASSNTRAFNPGLLMPGS